MMKQKTILPLVSISITNWNGKKIIKSCLESVAKLNYPKELLDVMVVDNGSIDGSVEFIKKYYPWVRLLAQKENKGFSASANIGIKSAKGKYTLILCNDNILDINCVLEMVKVLEADKRAGIAGAFQYEAENPNTILCAWGVVDKKTMKLTRIGVKEIDKGQYNSLVEADYVGLTALIRNEAIKEIGYIDERYFFGFEDIDTNLRLREAGYKVVFVPSAKIWHRLGNSLRRFRRRDIYFLSRNHLLLRSKMNGFSIIDHFRNIRFLTTSFLRSWYGKKNQQKDYHAVVRGIIDFYLKRFGPDKTNKYPHIAFLIPGLGIVDRGVEDAALELSKKLCKFYDITIFSRGKVAELEIYPRIKNKIIRAISRDNKVTNLIYKIHPELSRILDLLHLSPAEIEMLSFSIMVSPNLMRGKYDLLFPTNGVWGSLLCVIIRAIRKVPFVYASHGGEEPMIARLNPDAYVALTDYTYRWLNKFKPNLKVVTIPNGIDTKKFNPKVKPVKIDLERPIILTVAALIPVKRIELVIKAVAEMKRGSLLVLGEGPLHKNLERLGKLLLGEERFAIKKVPYNKIQHYYVAADVFTLPSYLEPSPLVFLEAAASGITIVAPDEERRRSTLKNAALYCDVSNSKEYAKALEKAGKINMYSELKKLVAEYDWEDIAKQYDSLFSELIK